MNTCIAIVPPRQALSAIERAMEHYAPYISNGADTSSWYIPLAFIPEHAAISPLKHPYVQILTILSLGEGDVPGQLWARIQDTPGLQELRKKVIAHVLSHRIPVLSDNSFLPHIFLGAFSSMPPLGIIDTPVRISFPIREAALVQVSPYEIIGQVPLTP